MAKKRGQLTDKEWQEEIFKIVKDLRQASKALVPLPERLRKYLSPDDDPPPRNSPGAGALPVPREELPMPRKARGSGHQG
jgi:hypothetical protein